MRSKTPALKILKENVIVSFVSPQPDSKYKINIKIDPFYRNDLLFIFKFTSSSSFEWSQCDSSDV